MKLSEAIDELLEIQARRDRLIEDVRAFQAAKEARATWLAHTIDSWRHDDATNRSKPVHRGAVVTLFESLPAIVKWDVPRVVLTPLQAAEEITLPEPYRWLQ